jgi:hypothetical protein
MSCGHLGPVADLRALLASGPRFSNAGSAAHLGGRRRTAGLVPTMDEHDQRGLEATLLTTESSQADR